MNTKPLAFVLALGLCSSASATLITYDYDFQADKSGTSGGESYVGTGRLTVDTAYFAITDLNLTTDAFTYEWSGIGYSIAEILRIENEFVSGNVISYAGDDIVFFFDYFSWPSGESPLAYLERVEEEYNFLDLPNGDTYAFNGKYRLAEVPEPSTLALLGLGLVGFAVKRRTSSRGPKC